MPDFPNTGAPMYGAAQASPWDTLNESGFIFDAFASRSIVEDRDLTAPPGSCANGDRFLIDATATGLWAGEDGKLAIAIGTNASNGWYFATVALHGNQLFVRDEDLLIEYDGAVWQTAPGGVSYMDDLTDVDATGVTTGDVLQYDGAEYVPVALASAVTIDTDATMAANSDAVVPSQKAVKTAIATAVTGLWDLKGSTDCSANPNYPAASKGDAYHVSVAGKIGGASGVTVEVGDVYLALADNAGGTQGAVGTSWSVYQGNIVGALLAANNLSDVGSASTARTNLGLGTAAVATTGTSGATVPLLNGANTHSGKTDLTAGGDLTPAATPSTTSLGYLGAPQNLGLDSGNVTLALTDCGKHLYHSDANARDLTIPANGSIAFPVGTVIAGVNGNGAGVITLKITSDTLRWQSSTGQRTIAANATFSLIKVASALWYLTGDGIT